MAISPANACEQANTAEEASAVVIDGPLGDPSETGSWPLSGIVLGEYLEQYRDQQVVLIIAPVGCWPASEPANLPGLRPITGTPMAGLARGTGSRAIGSFITQLDSGPNRPIILHVSSPGRRT